MSVLSWTNKDESESKSDNVETQNPINFINAHSLHEKPALNNVH